MIRNVSKKISVVCFAALAGLFFSTYCFASDVEIVKSPDDTDIHAEPPHLKSRSFFHPHASDNLWEVLRSDFELNHYEDNPLVKEQINYLLNHQEFLLNSANRAAPYLYYILEQTRKRHLPSEVALIPIIESAFNPFAYSPAGAAGIWQMMPSTASGYGVKQNWWYDGRRDVITSTKAALNHLSYLRNFFNNNWLLVIAAYDTGEGNVLSAIKKNIRYGYDTNFWSLSVAKETRDYVPRLLALATIIAHPERYPVYFPPVKNAPYLAQVDVGKQMDLKRTAQLAGISLSHLMQLNPGYNRMITDPNGPYRITLPIENVAQFTENLARISVAPTVNWKPYRVRRGDTLMALAKRYGSSPDTLKNVNKLINSRVKPGSNLLVPHGRLLARSSAPQPNDTYVPNTVNNPVEPKLEVYHSQYTLQPGDTVYVTRKGDTLLEVANRFNIPVVSLVAANNISQRGALPEGHRLIVPTHNRGPVISKKSSAYKLTAGDTVYMIRRGDTMEGIAKRFHTTAPEIRLTNLIADGDLREGESIVIPTHRNG